LCKNIVDLQKWFIVNLCMLERSEEHVVSYTAEVAVEQLGFSYFHWKIILFCSIFTVQHSSVIVHLCHKFYLIIYCAALC